MTEYSQEFLQWWKEYPRKIGKPAAFRAFNASIKKADLETLIAAVQEQRTTEALNRPERYIPHAATWLRQERWLDESSAPVKPTSLHSRWSEVFNTTDRKSALQEAVERAVNGR